MIGYFLITLFCLYYILLYLQEYHYHYNGFIEILKKGIKDKKNYLLLVTLFGLCTSISKYFILIVFVGFCFFVLLKLEDKLIIKLKFTKRVIRNIILNIIIYLLFYIFLYRYIFILPLFSLIIAFISFIILEPVELLIKKHYLKKARKKIRRIHPLVIAITGSAGKTSIKHFLYHILKDKYITFMTKGSVNTVMGIVKAINQEMSDLTEVAIFECGVSHCGDIDDILKVIEVDISIISTIFPQHLETFKSFELLVNEKAKLGNAKKLHLALDGIVNQLYQSNCDDVKIVGKDIILKDYQIGRYFSFQIKEKKYKWKCKVLGKNNLINILFAIYIANYLGLNFKYIERKVSTLENVNNRLKVRYQNDKMIIDDSFNSNYNGFCDALEVLKTMEGKKVVITPGIVSGGEYISQYNSDIALKIINVASECYLIESMVNKDIKEVFDKSLYEYHNVKDFNEAYNKVLRDEEVKVVLIENDIPDIYKG